MSNDWTFTQLGGDQKRFVLAGYAAPFGRPRQKPVAKEVIKSRVQTTNYPGRSGRPTRHTFGTMWEPIELNGRWATKNLKRSTANEVADAWREFIEDELPCRIAWGNITSYIGYIEELELGRESEHEIAWRMKILIDAPDDAEIERNPTPDKTILEWETEIAIELDRLKLKKPGDLLASIAGMAAEFQDGIDNFVRDLNGPSAALNKLAGIIGDTQKATFSTLQHLRSAVKGFQQAFLNIRTTVLMTPIDAAILARTVKSDVDWVQYQMDLDVRGNDIMALLAAMDRKAELAQRKQAVGVITAKGSDTVRGESWESISIRATGNASSAARIREMNGGAGHATPGEDYVF